MHHQPSGLLCGLGDHRPALRWSCALASGPALGAAPWHPGPALRAGPTAELRPPRARPCDRARAARNALAARSIDRPHDFHRL